MDHKEDKIVPIQPNQRLKSIPRRAEWIPVFFPETSMLDAAVTERIIDPRQRWDQDSRIKSERGLDLPLHLGSIFRVTWGSEM